MTTPGTKVRFTLAALCCLALAAIVAMGRWPVSQDRPGSDPGAGGRATASSVDSAVRRDCRACHAAVWEEWEQSYHARAWTDPNVQAAFRHFGYDRKCLSCHASEPVLAIGLAPPVLREANLDSGVDCLTCHALPDRSGVAARRTLPEAPCRPIAQPLLTASEHCSTCHVAIYKDWHASRYRQAGQSCQDCHMPPVASRQGGRSHLCLGGHDPPTVRGGAKMTCQVQGQELVVVVVNHATGHNFPGERHNRTLFVQVIQRRDHQITLARQELIKGITPFRGESSAEKLQVDQVFEVRFPVVDPPVIAEVQLLYKPFPWYPDRDALIVHSQELLIDTDAAAKSNTQAPPKLP